MNKFVTLCIIAVLNILFIDAFVSSAGEPLWSQLLFLERIRGFWEWQVVYTGLPPVTHKQHTHYLRLQPSVQLCCPHDIPATCCK